MMIVPLVALLVGSCVVESAAAGQPPALIITEIDYDQPGPDINEWIELHNQMDFEVSTEHVFLVLYKGDLSGTCTEYCRIDLSSLIAIPADSYVVIGNHVSAVLPLCAGVDAISNGPAAAIALAVIIGTENQTIDGVEYAAALGRTSCGFAKSYAEDRDAVNGSINRCGTSWVFTQIMTPGAPNSCTPPDVPDPPRPTWSTVKSLFK